MNHSKQNAWAQAWLHEVVNDVVRIYICCFHQIMVVSFFGGENHQPLAGHSSTFPHWMDGYFPHVTYE